MTGVASSEMDALALFVQGQASIGKLLEAYKGLCQRPGETGAEKRAVAQRLHLELTVVTLSQQELLGPLLRAASGDAALLRAQDASAWSLIAHVAMGEPGSPRFDARLLALGGELVRQVAEDGRGALTRVPASVDLKTIGAQMRRRQAELMDEFEAPLGIEDESADPVG
jgi:hypothetical protein